MFQPFSERARAKVNLALHVLGRRSDGYHDLDSIVAFADVGDDLRFSPADEFSITASGPFAAQLPPASENIISRVYGKVGGIATARGKVLPPVAVHLVKNLPVSSGIGGGSANAAAAMRGFLKIAELDAVDNGIMAAALSLGADVPVCLLGRACRMQGIGERITLLEGFEPIEVLLVNPRFEVSTPAVFRQLGVEKGAAFGEPIADVCDSTTWRNDLMAPAIAIAPVIGEVLDWLRQVPGVAQAGMSGSGATCFGVLRESAKDLEPPDNWWCAGTRLS
jgi:4-diphosphocytidyl-2-C-methyl-D-erythritol kinase